MAHLPAQVLARSLEQVRLHAASRPLPKTSGLSADQKIDLEERLVRESFAAARHNLGFA
jgi:hypothetical protein